MQRMYRLYLGNCGYRTAWYPGMIIPLTNPVTDDPTDTILHLENGGGKTTLMSLIFSCFETEQNRFLKHLQEPNNRFSQYFSNDGSPGFVAVEWLLPPRTAKGQPYRLVVGQAVSVRATVEPLEVERLFFSFVVRDDLTLEHIPGPHLRGKPATNFAEVERWAQQMKEANPDFFPTKIQADWKRHLKIDRLIDIEMLQMQVGFSAQEGGFDAFVKLKNEAEFVKKFLGLTLDPAKADEARKLVVEITTKHSRKPEFQARFDELSKFRGRLATFSDAADRYLDSVAQRAEVALQGAYLSQALQARSAVLFDEEQTERKEEQLQGKLRDEANDIGGRLARGHATVTWELHRKKVAGAQQLRERAEVRVRELEDRGRYVRAARLQKDILSFENQIKEMDALAEAEAQNLKPYKDHAELQGALLRRALFMEEARLERALSELDDREKARGGERKRLNDARDTAQRTETQLTSEDRTLRYAEDQRQHRLERLVSEGLMSDAGVDVQGAIGAWRQRAAQHEAERGDHLRNRETARRRAGECRMSTNQERRREAESSQKAASLEEFVGKGEAERERLSQHPALQEAVQADLADPYSLIVRQNLSLLISSYSQQIASVDVRSAELRLTKTAIETTRVAGYSAEVGHVVKLLRDAGVRSARAFNEYLAETVKDADRARALVASDPARFLGVCVTRTEFAQASAISWAGRLPRKPVMVSVTSLDPAPLPSDRCVVPAQDDSAFNIEAAARLAPQIAETLEADQRERIALKERHDRAVRVAQELEVFVATYGSGKIAEARAQAAIAAEDAEAARQRAQSLEEDARQLEVQAEDLFANANEAGEHGRAAVDRARRLEDFVKEHEAGRAQRLHRLGELPSLIAGVQEDRRIADVGLEELAMEHEKDATRRANERAQKGLVADERAKIDYYDRGYDAENHLRDQPRALDELRNLYRDAAKIYEAEEKDRLGTLSERLDGVRQRKADKQHEFTRDYPGVKPADMKPFLTIDQDSFIRETDSELAGARAQQSEVAAEEKLTKKQSQTWHDANKALVDQPDPAIVKMDIGLLEVEAARIDELHALQGRRALEAGEAAKAARIRADAKKAQASADSTADQMLRGSLGFGEQADVAKIIAETLGLTGVQLRDEEQPLVLQQPADQQVSTLIRAYAERGTDLIKFEKAARQEFDRLRLAASAKEFVTADAGVAHEMQENQFEATCRSAQRLLTILDDRIATTKSTLDTMDADFGACVEEVYDVVRGAILTLEKAASPDKRVPPGAPYIGGKQVLRMRANFGKFRADERKQAIRNYMNILTETKQIPVTGTDLVAECVTRIYGQPLGLQVLKMSPEETEQYVVIERISNSGGEGVVMAMFLYLLINQLRAENFAEVQKSAGGPLLLDNPFAKVTSGAMWKAQRMLAAAMNVQLVFATAVEDYNALAEFQRFVRLRKAGPHSGTRRWHLEMVEYAFTPEQETIAS